MEEPRLRQRHGRGQELRYVIKVVACGGMIGTALLFPLANVEGLWFGSVTLSIFILSALGFHALHLQPFVRFGPFTVAIALVLLLVAVLSAGPSRKDLIPWLPLFIASWSLMTVAIYEIAQHLGPRRVSFTADKEYTGASLDTWSERSLRTLSTLPGRPPLLESNRHNPLYFARHGPPSRTSHRTGTGSSDISLTSVVGQCRPGWDPRTRSYFLSDDTLPGEDPEDDQTGQHESHVGIVSPSGEASGPGLDPDQESDDDEALAPSHPLLGPR